MGKVLYISVHRGNSRSSRLKQTLQMEKPQEKLPELLIPPTVDDDIDTRVQDKKQMREISHNRTPV